MLGRNQFTFFAFGQANIDKNMRQRNQVFWVSFHQATRHNELREMFSTNFIIFFTLSFIFCQMLRSLSQSWHPFDFPLSSFLTLAMLLS